MSQNEREKRMREHKMKKKKNIWHERTNTVKIHEQCLEATFQLSKINKNFELHLFFLPL